mmetsp:Transcript_28856/g.54091  ORF Transcript_28856/g.54091 Transcript_28856/m.54091 type:complete len:222 (+) Transcript_28856:70-735(+)
MGKAQAPRRSGATLRQRASRQAAAKACSKAKSGKVRPGDMLAPHCVAVKRSCFAGAGKGLFAVDATPRGVYLPGPYQGAMLGREELSRVRDYSYCVLLPGSKPKAAAIDAKKCRRGNLLRYVNGARTTKQRQCINTKIVCQRSQVHFVTTRRVESGTEFIVDYGPTYWQCWAHNHRVDELRADIREAKRRLAAATSDAARRRWALSVERAWEAFEDYVDEA